jgi:hypothetical protein
VEIDESSFFSSEDLRQMQDRETAGRGSGDLREPQAQAAAGVMVETGN